MQSKSCAEIFRKILYGVMLLGLILSALRVSNPPAVLAQKVWAESSTESPTEATTETPPKTQIPNANVQLISQLPDFRLPYEKNITVYWTGGPHAYNFGGQLGAKYPTGEGSGLDFSNGSNFDVLAMASGNVIDAGCDNTRPFGCQVAIQHDIGGTVLIYAHLMQGSIPARIIVGQHVSQGWVLGKAGNTGEQTNIHLHIEFRNGQKDGNGNWDCTRQCLPGNLGGNPMGWDDGIPFVDGYYIFSYLVDSEGLESYNYDGSAVKGDSSKILSSGFYYDDNGTPTQPYGVRVHTDFTCLYPDDPNKNCELPEDHSDPAEATKFATTQRIYTFSALESLLSHDPSLQGFTLNPENILQSTNLPDNGLAPLWWPLGAGVYPAVLALAFDGSGNLYAGGSVSTAGGNPANKIAKWDGSTWSPLGAGLNGQVSALVFDGNGNLYAGGFFTTAGGNPANSIAKWDGSAWSPLGTGINGGCGCVLALAVDRNGNLYAGGSFFGAGGNPANSIAKWDGSAWSPLGTGTNGVVSALAFDGSGNLYASGWYSSSGGNTVYYIAKWDGSTWSTLGTGMNGGISAIAFDGSGNLYAGGWFSTAGGNAANYVAKWDGSAWSPLGSGLSGSDSYYGVLALAFDSSGDLYAGGAFTTAGDNSANRIAKWDGSTWSPLGKGISGLSSITPMVNALAFDGSGNLYAGGGFHFAGGNNANYIAKWDGSASLPPCDSGPITVMNNHDSGAGSLRQATTEICPGGTIQFDASLAGQTIILNSKLIVSRDLTIDGSSLSDHIRISGNNAVRVFEVYTGVTTTFQDLDIINAGDSAELIEGGGISNSGTLIVKNSNLLNNKTNGGGLTIGDGGGINNTGTLTVINSTLSGNSAYSSGGAVYNGGGKVTVTNSTILGNLGGGIFNGLGGSITILDSSFSGNESNYDGGAINNHNDSTLAVRNSTFTNNSADGGGGIENAGVMIVTDSTFASNSSGIENYGTLVVTNTIFTGNSGGGIYNIQASLTVTDSTFSGNTAIDGGGIYNNSGTITVTNSTFSNNSANYGGGIYNSRYNYDAPGSAVVTNSTFSGNSAVTYGGGIVNLVGSPLTVTNSTFSDNSAGLGGGIYNYLSGMMNLTNTILANSIAGMDCYNAAIMGTNIKNLIEVNGGSANDCGTPALSSDPKLSPLANNGGPTQTFALLPGSPAIDAGDDATCNASPVNGLDQRGVARSQGVHCDIGAYELENITTTSWIYLPLVIR